MEGKGYTRFTDIKEVVELIHPFTLEAIEILSRTVNNRTHQIKELLIFGEKIVPSES